MLTLIKFLKVAIWLSMAGMLGSWAMGAEIVRELWRAWA